MYEYLSNEDKQLISAVANYDVDDLIREVDVHPLKTQIFSNERLIFNKDLNKKGLHILRTVLSRRVNDERQRVRSHKYDKDLLKRFNQDGCLVLDDVFTEKDVHGNTLKVNERYINILQMTLGDDTIPEYQLLTIQNMPTPASKPTFDPQTDSHFDTFHPTCKVWVYLADVEMRHAPLHYSIGTNINNRQKLQFLYDLSVRLDAINEGDFRDFKHEFPEPSPVFGRRFTTIFVDVVGFHKRGMGEPGNFRLSARGNVLRKNPFRDVHA